VLLERPGELVTREELRNRLWPGELYVDFEHGLNRSINKLRRALLDEASSPIYIETLSTRGYRFIAAVERLEQIADLATNPQSTKGPLHATTGDQEQTRSDRSRIWGFAFVVLALAVAATLSLQLWRNVHRRAR